MTEQRSDAAERAVLRCAGLAKRFGSVQAVEGFDLDVGPSEILALLGPSGCGKTTALRLIAGFEQPDAGRITIRGHEMSAPGHNDPPERRRVGLVFQDFALFPHMTVAENVRFGMQERTAAGQTRSALARRLGRAAGALGGGTERAGADDRVGNLLRLVALEAFGERYPHELSGGEAQRVALARALARTPDLILLDEPFSNLDTQLRAAVRAEMREILERVGVAAIFVTHDQEEALSLADRVAVMRAGAIHQVGTPAEIYEQPATRFVAEFVGNANFLPATASEDGLQTALGSLSLSAADRARLPRSGAALEALVRPELVKLLPAGGAGSTAATGAMATVIAREYYGHDQILRVRLDDGLELEARLGPTERLRPGERVGVRVTDAVRFFAADADS